MGKWSKLDNALQQTLGMSYGEKSSNILAEVLM